MIILKFNMTIFIMIIPYHGYITKPLIVIVTLGSESNLKIIICYAKMDEFLYDWVARAKPFMTFLARFIPILA